MIWVLFSDIQFWNKNKSMEGLSAKSVILNFVCQLIVFLYLLDNDTSWMILASSGIGVCIEFWKIGKAMHIEVNGIYGSLSPWVCGTKYAFWFFTRKLNIFGNCKRSSWLKDGDNQIKDYEHKKDVYRYSLPPHCSLAVPVGTSCIFKCTVLLYAELLWPLTLDVFWYIRWCQNVYDNLLSVGVDIYIASVSWHCLSRVDTWWPFVLNERFSFLFSRSIEVERFPCWGFETEIHMHRIRPRSMMRLQWSTLPMSFSSLWLVSLSTLWSMKSTRAGTRGYSLLWQVVCTCLVRN